MTAHTSIFDVFGGFKQFRGIDRWLKVGCDATGYKAMGSVGECIATREFQL